jgi:hypothetical protein
MYKMMLFSTDYMEVKRWCEDLTAMKEQASRYYGFSAQSAAIA